MIPPSTRIRAFVIVFSVMCALVILLVVVAEFSELKWVKKIEEMGQSAGRMIFTAAAITFVSVEGVPMLAHWLRRAEVQKREKKDGKPDGRKAKIGCTGSGNPGVGRWRRGNFVRKQPRGRTGSLPSQPHPNHVAPQAVNDNHNPQPHTKAPVSAGAFALIRETTTHQKARVSESPGPSNCLCLSEELAMPAIEQGTRDIATLVAGTGSLVIIAGMLIKGAAWLLRRTNRGVDEARQAFRDVQPEQTVVFHSRRPCVSPNGLCRPADLRFL